MGDVTAVPSIEGSVDHHAQRRPEALAAVGPSGSLTWAQLQRAVASATRMLAAADVGVGDRIGWLGANDIGYLVVLMATWGRRASLVGLNWRLSIDEAKDSADRVGCSHVFVGAELAETTSVLGAHTVVDADQVQQWIDEEGADERLVAEPSDEAILFFTSGSTGVPKAVPLSRHAVETHAATRNGHNFTTTSRMLVIPPIFHLAGACWVQYGLISGATQVYVTDASPSGLAAALTEHEITHTVFVPLLIQLLVEEAERTGVRFPHLQQIAYGASPITLSMLERAVNVLECELYQVYGMSEGGGVVTALWPADHALVGPTASRLASAGCPVDGAAIKIVDLVTGEEATPGVVGEICVHTPFMFSGYDGNEAASQDLFVDGWLRTADAGYVDEDGYLFIKGRTDDVIITGGENVHPSEVENVLATMPQVAECAVFGVPDERWGRRVAAAVVPRPGVELTKEDVTEYCRPRLGGVRTPKRVMIVDELMRTPAGKIRRNELAKKAGEAS